MRRKGFRAGMTVCVKPSNVIATIVSRCQNCQNIWWCESKQWKEQKRVHEENMVRIPKPKG